MHPKHEEGRQNKKMSERQVGEEEKRRSNAERNAAQSQLIFSLFSIRPAVWTDM